MLRLASIAAKLKVPTVKVQADILVKASGRMFMKWGEDYFAYKAAKDVIVPYELAYEYARIGYKMILPPPASIRDAEVLNLTADQDEKKRLVLTLLGHFNHGKTSLLDTLINHSQLSPLSSSLSISPSISSVNTSDNTNVAGKGQRIGDLTQHFSNLVSEEKYGITQEVRSRHISISPQYELTLIDTPGQEIFYRMRNTGSEVSDGSLLLIAVDDEIQLQTRESIGLIESSNKPVIVCINKVDLVASSGNDNSPIDYSQLPKVKAVIDECRDYIALEKAPIIPISATASINLDLLTKEIMKLFDTKYSSSLRRGRANRLPRISRQDNTRADIHNNTSSMTDNNREGSVANLTVIAPDDYEALTGRGVVLNLVHEQGTPPSIHVLLREGTIRVGDFLQAGGWMGRVRGLYIEDAKANNDSSSTSSETKAKKDEKHKKDNQLSKEKSQKKSSQPKNPYRILDVAYAGMAVRIVPTYLEECVDPRPVGERIHFFSPHVLEVERAQEKIQEGKAGELLSLEKKKLENQSKEEALRARDEFIMEEEIGAFHLTDAQTARFHLLRLFSLTHLSKNHFYVKAKQATSSLGTSTSSTADYHSEDDNISDNDEVKEKDEQAERPTENRSPLTVVEAKSPMLIICRMRSDLDMGTFLDRYHDYRDYCAANKIPAKIRVVQSGIGTISKSDVQVGIAAGKNALLVGYGVEIESFAMKDAKENQLKILMHDNMPDLLQQVFGSYGSVSDDCLNGTGNDKKKKKKKKNKNKPSLASNDKIEEKGIKSG